MSVNIIGWALIHSLWQGAVVAAVATVALALTRRGAASIRYAIGLASMGLMAAAPLATALLLDARSLGAAPSAALGTGTIAGSSFGGGNGAAVRVTGPGSVTVSSSGRAGSGTVVPSRSNAGPSVRLQLLRSRLESAMPWLVAVWLAGVFLLSLRLIGGLLRTRRLLTDSTHPAEARLALVVHCLAEQLGVRRLIRVMEAAHGHVPLVVGWLRPAILVPAASLSGLTPHHLELILAHEIAHIRRYDFLVNVLQTIVETLLFYHPSVWWISARIRDEREHCCDDLAMRTLGADGETYARALLAVEEWRGASVGLAAAATGGSLLGRVRRIVAAEPTHLDLGSRWAAGVVGFAAVALAARGVLGGAPAGAGRLTPSETEFAVPDRLGSAPSSKPERAAADSTRARPSSVIRYSGTASMAERWRWAEARARADRLDSLWIGYVVAGDANGQSWFHLDRRVPVRIGDSWISGTLSFSGGGDQNKVIFSGTGLSPLVGEHAPYDLAVFFGVTRTGDRQRLVRIHLGNFAFPMFFDRWPLVWLGGAGDPESIALVSELLSTTEIPHMREDLVTVIGAHRTSDAVVPVLRTLLLAESQPEGIRSESADWLAHHPDPRALSALARAARADGPERVRRSAIEALARFDREAAADTLIALARQLDDSDLRREAIEAMGHRSEPRAFDALVAIVRDDRDPKAQREAVETVGESVDQRRMSVLTDLVRKDASAGVRKEAVETLAQASKGNDVVAVLVSVALRDPDESVQEAALGALANVEDATAVAALLDIALRAESRKLQRAAAEALGGSHVHEPAIAALRELAWRHADIDVQKAAVEAFDGYDDTRVVALLADVADRHPNLQVQVTAAEALGDVHPHEPAIAALQRMAWQHAQIDVQRAAVETLGGFDDRSATELLLDIARRHPNPQIRKAAIEALH